MRRVCGRTHRSGADLSRPMAVAADACGLDPSPPRPRPERRLLARRSGGRRRGARARRHAPRQLATAGYEIVDAPDLGLDPITAVHDAEFVDFMSRALRGMGGRRSPRRPGSAAGRAVPVRDRPFARGTPPGGARRRSGPRSGCTRWTRCRSSARGRSTPRAPPSTPPSTPATSCRRAASGVRRGAPARSPRRPGVLRRVVLLQQRRGGRPATARRRLSNGLRSSTSTPTRATARRRSSGSGPTSSTRASMSIRRRMVPAPRRPRPRARWRRWRGADRQRADARRRGRRTVARRAATVRRRRDGTDPRLVVSLGVDAAVDDPAAPLEVTAAGFPAAGARSPRSGPDRVRAGGRLRPRPARRPRDRGAEGFEEAPCLRSRRRGGSATDEVRRHPQPWPSRRRSAAALAARRHRRNGAAAPPRRVAGRPLDRLHARPGHVGHVAARRRWRAAACG